MVSQYIILDSDSVKLPLGRGSSIKSTNLGIFCGPSGWLLTRSSVFGHSQTKLLYKLSSESTFFNLRAVLETLSPRRVIPFASDLT